MASYQHIELDPATCPLEGTNLIEASAGTGKTHTIGSLVLRLLLEKALDISQILVVTFTEAATEELRERIRARLKDAFDAFADTRGSRDEFIDALIKKGTIARNTACFLLQEAIRRFDEAAIYTIHGLCARILTDHAFEMGQVFDAQLITEETHLLEKLAYDFWRKNVYPAHPGFVGVALDKKFLPSELVGLLGDIMKWPGLKILPEDTPGGLPDLGPLEAKFMEMKKAWPMWREEIRRILMSPDLKANRYGSLSKDRGRPSKREDMITLMFGQMDQWIARQWPLLPLFRHFEKFTARYLSESVKKGKDLQGNPFFELADEVYELFNRTQEQIGAYLVGLRAEFGRVALEELKKEKRHNNVRGYQDLILETVEALRSRGAGRIVASLRRRYKAALIDEFHDTDSLQYFIFTSVFGTGSRPLLLVGDPKQAIYAFRGADIFAYLRATSEVQRKYTLTTNWRSHPTLIDGVNALFKVKDRPFLFKEIDYIDARPTTRRKIEPLVIQGGSPAPLQLWYLKGDPEREKGNTVTKTRARTILARAVASEISRLLWLGREKRAFIGQETVKEKHIAVLVRTNDEAIIIRDALRSFGIHSALYTGENVFDTRQAWEMEQIAGAVAFPEDASLIRGALATDVFAMNAEGIVGLDQDNQKWEEVVLRFREYRQVWERKGFLPMFRRLLDKERSYEKLLQWPDGERKIGNLLQISEVIQRVSDEQGLGIHETVAWLSRQRDSETPRSQEHQLRLESDDEAVKVLTIHKSKGLEFPIVFCPYAWGGADTRKNEVKFHQPEEGRFVCDLGSEEIDKHRALAAREELAENIRLLYVAVTRAKSACYVAWGNINQTDTSAFAYLLCGPEHFSDEDVVRETSRLYGQMGREGIEKRLKELEQISRGAIEISAPPAAGKRLAPPKTDTEILTARQFNARIADDWRVSSFSSLISGYDLAAEFPDHDQVSHVPGIPDPEAEAKSSEKRLSIFDFPKGPEAGTLIHKILEEVDFEQGKRHLHTELIEKRLVDYGFDTVWTDVLCQMVENLRAARLDPSASAPRLEHVPMSRRLNEIEFYFPLRRVSPQTLSGLFKEIDLPQGLASVPERIGALQFSPARGFMKGFIDMVFEWQGRYYLVDWKSNFLGPAVEDYGQGALQEEMVRHYYVLQYHLYCLALDQFLRLRLTGYDYDKHFGKVYYIFVRGVDPELSPEYGVFSARPSREALERLRRELIG